MQRRRVDHHDGLGQLRMEPAEQDLVTALAIGTGFVRKFPRKCFEPRHPPLRFRPCHDVSQNRGPTLAVPNICLQR